MFGILNINKPAGVTSRDVVNHVQRRVRPHKAGHAGTLDPLATGVLVVCVGPATKLIQYVQQMPKQYLATFRLGVYSDTEDIEGEVKELVGAPVPTPAELEAALPKFTGKIQQRPPAYSAVKIKGQRAYKLARAGKQFDVSAREIEIHSLRGVEYQYPKLVLDVGCGSGTYIRTLGRDLAESSGSGAVMEQLQRTAIGEFVVDAAKELNNLAGEDEIQQALHSPFDALSMLPRRIVSEEELEHLRNGRSIASENESNTGETVAVNANGQLVAVLATRRDGRVSSKINFAHLV